MEEYFSSNKNIKYMFVLSRRVKINTCTKNIDFFDEVQE